MNRNILIFLLYTIFTNHVFSQHIKDNSISASPLYVDTNFIQTVDTIGNVRLIQYFHKKKEYKGRKMFMGKDEYLIKPSEVLILSSRNDYDNKITVSYGYFETGQIKKILLCELEGPCELTYYYENGRVKHKSFYNSEGENIYCTVHYDIKGRVVEIIKYSEDE